MLAGELAGASGSPAFAGSGCVAAGFVSPPSAGGAVPSLSGGPCGSGACASAEGLGSEPFPCNGSWSGVAVGAPGCVAVVAPGAAPRCPKAYPSPKQSPQRRSSPKTIPSSAAVPSVSSVSRPRSRPRFRGSSPAASSSSKYPRDKLSPRQNVPASKYPGNRPPLPHQLFSVAPSRSCMIYGCF